VWSELQCVGFIPSPREGHAAALVDDIIYIFGGRDVDGKDLGDLAAFKITSQLIPCQSDPFPKLIPSYRSTMVYVPEHGCFPKWPLWTRYGVSRYQGVRPSWRVINTIKDGQS